VSVVFHASRRGLFALVAQHAAAHDFPLIALVFEPAGCFQFFQVFKAFNRFI
jgi:hypothetical protein